MSCPVLEKCAFFNDKMANMPAMAEFLKKQYCNGEYESCARYKVKQETGKSHPSLMPNENEKVDEATREMIEHG